jgi:hypothetical protein
MTQAFNLAQLANAVDTAGKLNVGTNAVGILPVANGGSGASTFVANRVLLGNGTSAFQQVAPSTNGNVLTSNGTTWVSATPAVATGLGLNGQVWNNVTGSRGLDATYTNSRTYPILVNISIADNVANRQHYLIVNGVTVASTYLGSNLNSAIFFFSAIVPPSGTYRAEATGSGIVSNWSELF